jgi:hypothetical protein
MSHRVSFLFSSGVTPAANHYTATSQNAIYILPYSATRQSLLFTLYTPKHNARYARPPLYLCCTRRGIQIWIQKKKKRELLCYARNKFNQGTPQITTFSLLPSVNDACLFLHVFNLPHFGGLS